MMGTRASPSSDAIHPIFVKTFSRRRWMRGSSPRMTGWKSQDSLHPDLGVPDDRLVFRHLVADIGRELRAARSDRVESERAQSLPGVGKRQHLGDLALQLGGDVGRQVLRTPQSVPGHELESFRAGFLD